MLLVLAGLMGSQLQVVPDPHVLPAPQHDRNGKAVLQWPRSPELPFHWPPTNGVSTPIQLGLELVMELLRGFPRATRKVGLSGPGWVRG